MEYRPEMSMNARYNHVSEKPDYNKQRKGDSLSSERIQSGLQPLVVQLLCLGLFSVR